MSSTFLVCVDDPTMNMPWMVLEHTFYYLFKHTNYTTSTNKKLSIISICIGLCIIYYAICIDDLLKWPHPSGIRLKISRDFVLARAKAGVLGIECSCFIVDYSAGRFDAAQPQIALDAFALRFICLSIDCVWMWGGTCSWRLWRLLVWICITAWFMWYFIYSKMNFMNYVETHLSF